MRTEDGEQAAAGTDLAVRSALGLPWIRFAKRLLIGASALAALLGLLIAAFGVVVTRVPEYRVQVQDWINARSGLAVEFRRLRARLRIYGPELVFDEAVVRTPDRTRVLATATRGSVGFDVWRALRQGRLSAGRFSLKSPQIGLIRTRAGRIQLLGQSALPERTDAKPFALEELPTGRFDVDDAVVTFRDEITGRGPWSVSGVDFKLTRTEDRLRLHGSASLPETLGRRLFFTASADGPLEQYATLVSTFGIEGEALDLAGWADVLPDHWPAPEAGVGSVRMTGALNGARLTQLAVQVDLRKVAAAAPAWSIAPPAATPMQRPDEAIDFTEPAEDQPSQHEALAQPAPDAPALPQLVSYERIAFALKAQQVDDAWSATLQDLDLARSDAAWRASQLRLRWARREGGAFELEGAADRVVLDSLWPLLAFLPESAHLARLRALHARGALENVAVNFARTAAAAPPRYEIKAQLRSVGFDPVETAPGLAGLSGEIEATDAGGRWRLASDELRFELPRWFRDPLGARIESGEISWRRGDAEWTVQGADLRLRSDDGRAHARFALSIPQQGSPVLDLQAHGEDLKVSATSRYIPAGRLGAGTMAWFDQAFLDGRVVAADFIYRGPTRDFPFRRGEGEFLVRGQVEDAVFSYQPEWTPATEVRAEVEFRNEGMRIRSTGANVGGLRVTSAAAQIKDLKETVLTIEAAAQGDLKDGLQFLKASPLGPKLGEQFGKLNGAGRLTADVRLHLPIRRLANRNVEVTARVADATASLAGLEAPVRRLSGALTVRNTLLAAANLRGEWLGGPVKLTVASEARETAALTAQGRATAQRLRALLDVPPAIGLSGAADWRLATRLSAAQEDEPAARVVTIESDTQGLELGLPAPLGKSASEIRHLALALELDDRGGALLRGAFGEVRSLLRLDRSGGKWSLDRGGMRADGVAPSLPDHAGLRIEGAVERFVLDDWLALRVEGAQGRPLAEYLHAANVRVHELQAFGFTWPDVRGLLQATPWGWRLDVSGPDAAGQILIPPDLAGDQPLRATLERLALQKTAADSAASATRIADPRRLPAVQAHVGNLRLGARTIGGVDLKASRTSQGVRFDEIVISSDSLRAEGRGHWFVTSDGQHSALQARIVSSDAAATLRALNYSPFLEAKRGEIRVDVAWPGGFDGNILAHASGGLSVEAETGQLVNLQPGAGRVLGLFSIAALPRRLALDFSDLTEKGLAFDRIHGDFELRDGHAHTSNLLLTGPAAEIGVAGRTGLGTRDYDQTAVVTGKLGASLPVAGALAGGPAVGAALLLFSQVFKEPLKGMTRGYYRITGPWDNPTVERIDAEQANGQRTSG